MHPDTRVSLRDLSKSEKLKRLITENLQDNRKNLEGKLLTFAEATNADKEQREAVKSLIRNLIQDAWFKMHWEIVSYLDGYQKVIGENKPEYDQPVTNTWRDKSYIFDDKKPPKVKFEK